MATCSFIPDKTSGVGVLLRLEYDNSSWPGSEIIYMVVPLRFLGLATAFLPFASKMGLAFWHTRRRLIFLYTFAIFLASQKHFIASMM